METLIRYFVNVTSASLFQATIQSVRDNLFRAGVREWDGCSRNQNAQTHEVDLVTTLIASSRAVEDRSLVDSQFLHHCAH